MSEPARTKTFLVMTFLSIRSTPGLSGERLPRFLGTGTRITVDADSRTEADGFIWWEHEAGWSAEGKLDGSKTYLKLVSESPEPATTEEEPSPPEPEPEPAVEKPPEPDKPTAPEPGDETSPPDTGGAKAEPKRFKVLTNLSIRRKPSILAQRTGSGQLAAGQVITVDPDSRTEADGFIWWKHDQGWSAEAKLNGSDTYLGAPDTRVPGAIDFTPDGLPDVASLPQRDALVTRMPVDLARTQWVQYFGNTKFAFKNGARWNYDAFAQGLHSGFDFGNMRPAGIPVYAGVSGTFLRNNRYGIAIKSGEYVIIYQHLHKNTTYVPGGVVTPETVMGEMQPGDNHLHFEIRYSAEKWIINPLLMMPEAMRQGLMQKFPTYTRHFQPYEQWQTPLEQPVIVRGGPIIGPRAR